MSAIVEIFRWKRDFLMLLQKTEQKFWNQIRGKFYTTNCNNFEI